MSSKMLVIISTGEAEKALTGLMYATNAMRFGWMDEIKVIIFGPAQQLILEDERVSTAIRAIADEEPPIACKFISDRDGTSGKTEELGLRVEYVGQMISDFVKDGYIPMVF